MRFSHFGLALAGYFFLLNPTWASLDEDCDGVFSLGLPSLEGRLAGEDVAYDEDGEVFFKGQYFRDLSVERDDVYIRFALQEEYQEPQASALIPLFHGVGSRHSHAGAMLSLLNLLGSNRTKKLHGRLKTLPSYEPVYTEAIDLPAHGASPIDEKSIPALEDFDVWLDSYFNRLLKSTGKDLPVVPIARSASAGLLVNYSLQNPGRLKGLILASPLLPQFLDEGIQRVEDLARAGSLVLNATGFNWVNRLYREMEWHRNNVAFGATPTLVFLGSEDQELPAEVRTRRLELLRKWESQHPDALRVVEVPNSGHDVFQTRQKDNFLLVANEIFEFLKGLR